MSLCNPGLSQVMMKTRAQHAAAALSGSRLSSIKCVVDSTLQYTMPNDISSQVQDPPPLSPASWPVDHQESVIPALLPPAIGLQIKDQCPVLPVEDPKFCRSAHNPYVDPLVCRLVVNEAANTIHSLEDGPKRIIMGGVRYLMAKMMTARTPTKIWLCQTTCTARSVATLGR